MSDEAKFKVNDVIYEFPTKFRLGDAVLIRKITGVDVAALKHAGALTSLTAYFAVAVAQKNPDWSHDDVIAFVSDLDLDALDVDGGKQGPPVDVPVEETSSPGTSNDSTTTPAGFETDPS